MICSHVDKNEEKNHGKVNIKHEMKIYIIGAKNHGEWCFLLLLRSRSFCVSNGKRQPETSSDTERERCVY